MKVFYVTDKITETNKDEWSYELWLCRKFNPTKVCSYISIGFYMNILYNEVIH